MSALASPAPRGLLRRLRSPFGIALLIGLCAVAYTLLFPRDLALLTRICVAMLFVLSLDLVVGYSGVVTLGHAALFGAGAYAAGIAASRGFSDPTALLALGVVSGALMGLASGALILRRKGLTQIVLSIAIVLLLREAANKLTDLTGGSDGLSGVDPGPLLGLWRFDIASRTASALGAVTVVITFLLLSRLVRSPFGMVCQAIRQDEVRVRAMGIAPYPHLVIMYAISGGVAGLAGALSAISAGVVGLDSLSFERSAEALVMLILGGKGTLVGALLGAGAFVWLEHFLSALDPFRWLILLGASLVAVVLVLPRGLVRLTARRS